MTETQSGAMFGLLILGLAMTGVGAILRGEDATQKWGRWILWLGIAHLLPPVLALWVVALAG